MYDTALVFASLISVETRLWLNYFFRDQEDQNNISFLLLFVVIQVAYSSVLSNVCLILFAFSFYISLKTVEATMKGEALKIPVNEFIF